MQLISPETEAILNRYEIQALISLSLFLQVILIVLGAKRKRTTSKLISSLVWSAYLSADWVATVALGILARSFLQKCEKNPDSSLQAFWAPFILLHLGGPDTITAYSLEDNDLWLRHLLGLVFQVGVAFYIFFRSWGTTESSSSRITLPLIAIPVYISGIIKYGERTWALWSSSTKQFKTSLLSPDDGSPEMNVNNIGIHSRAAFFLFERLKALYSGYSLDSRNGEISSRIICKLNSSAEAFKLVEFELGLLYDVLYTKARIVYSRYGVVFRCITCFASVSALVAFLDIRHGLAYSSVDISVTYLLLVGAVVLEAYALAVITFSDWTLVGRKIKGCCTCNGSKRWSRAIAQFSLINFCLPKERSVWIELEKLIGIHGTLEKHRNVTWKQGVDGELQDLIFKQLKERTEKHPGYLKNTKLCAKLLNYRGDCILGEQGIYFHDLKWSTIGVEFSDSVFLWHIATELCYYDDINKFGSENNVTEYSKISRCLSSYMLYLLVLCPDMLPKGISQIRCNQAFEEAKRIFSINRMKRMKDATEYLMQINVEGSSSSSISQDNLLIGGRRLAYELQDMQSYRWTCSKKWEVMNGVWVELLTYAASHCGWKEHGHHLRKGGELLTHVGVLMANLGLCEQYQVSPILTYQNQGRA